MRTIIAATDLNTASKQAIEFAAQIAATTGAKLVIFHAVHPMLSPPADPDTLTELKKTALAKIKRIGKKLIEKNEDLNVEYLCTIGLAADDLVFYAEKLHAGLIVTGMRRETDLSDQIFGTVTTGLVRHSPVPVLCIHEKQKYRDIKKIVFASDFAPLKNKTIISELRKIATSFNAEILILHVFKNAGEIPDFEKAYEGLKIENALKGSRHSFHTVTDPDVVRGITTFAQQHDADIVAMVPHDKPLLEKIFTRSASKKMAFRSNIPLLTFSDLQDRGGKE